MSAPEIARSVVVIAWFGPGTALTALHERADGAQGYSGATLRYYDVGYAGPGCAGRSRSSPRTPR